MDTIKRTMVGTAELSLTARDQYNDYSVVYDYTLWLVDREHKVERCWHAGRNRADALELFERAIPVVRRLQS